MKYLPSHAERALEIMERFMGVVSPRPEYEELVEILRAPDRWPEGHKLFQRIRVSITLPAERRGEDSLEYFFVFIAENAAKTAYNCSGEPGPFDNDSFEWLLKCEQQFIERQNKS